MELLVLMTTTRVDRLVVTVRVATIGSARLVADQMTTTAETMDGVHHREETRTDHRHHLDENHMATTHTTEVDRHHLGAMPTLTPEMGIRILEGQGLHQGELMEVDIQPMRDIGEAPHLPYMTPRYLYLSSRIFLKLIGIDHPHRTHTCRRTSFSLINDGF
jgi:hypothetical protein